MNPVVNPATAIPVLQLQSVSKRFSPSGPPVLDDVSLSAQPGSRVAIVGPSGSGKTTLLRIIAGFETPDSGSMTLQGKVLLDAAAPAVNVPAHLRRIGFVPQEGALFPHLTIAENIGFGLPRSEPGRAERIDELLDMVSLERRMGRLRPHELSGGQQQRVALSRALALRPALILLDEPFSALDTGLRAATRQAVARLLTDAGITAILVTHDQAEALSFADQVAVMRGGRLVQAGAPQSVYYAPADADAAAFLGPAIVLPARISGGLAHCALGAIPLARAGADDGDATIMLRPEQVTVALAPSEVMSNVVSNAAADGVRAQIMAIEFLGGFSGLRMTLAAPRGGDCEIMLMTASTPALAVGSRVVLRTEGPAHVF